MTEQHATTTDERLLTMQESMDYLSERGVPCRSRSSFYRLVENFQIPYINTNPHGRYEVRRFAQAALDQFIKSYTTAQTAMA